MALLRSQLAAVDAKIAAATADTKATALHFPGLEGAEGELQRLGVQVEKFPQRQPEPEPAAPSSQGRPRPPGT